MKQFEKILIANRGEIAVRIIRAAQMNGIRSVAVYAADDADSLHVSLTDETVFLSGNSLAETYLNEEKIIQIALDSGVDAIHPGYGFLSENAGFAQKVTEAGLVFIGPSPENIRLMGEKNRALAYVESLGIPILKSFRGSNEELLNHAPEMDFPVMVKASGGGGGKGIVICNSVEELAPALEKAERQALTYFGNGELFVEKYLARARHIEVQLMADHHGNVLHFFERECSVQRRFQKIIEEAPSPTIDEIQRAALTSAAVKIAKSMNYRNAGTIEFLLDENGHFYFLEMNTRIQVEHPVTELITNVDLVSLQMVVASGKPLPIKQEDIQISGHAIEVRLCAEDAEDNFKPSSGLLKLWQIPKENNFRIETFLTEGNVVSPNYDSLLAKLIVWSENRTSAVQEMHQVISKTGIVGVHTNLAFLSEMIGSETFQNNTIYTRFVDENLNLINQQIRDKKSGLDRHKLAIAYLIFQLQQRKHSGNSVWNQVGYWRMSPVAEVLVDSEKLKCSFRQNEHGQIFKFNQVEYLVSDVHLNGNLLELNINQQPDSFYCLNEANATQIVFGGFSFLVRSNLVKDQVILNRIKVSSERVFQNLICADLFGKVLKLNISKGDRVKVGQVLLTLESMKTEIHVLSPVDGRVKKVHVMEGTAVVEKQLLVELQAPSDSPEGGEKRSPDSAEKL